jgi:hypothetical protein
MIARKSFPQRRMPQFKSAADQASPTQRGARLSCFNQRARGDSCLAQRVYRMFLVDPKLLKLKLLKEIL